VGEPERKRSVDGRALALACAVALFAAAVPATVCAQGQPPTASGVVQESRDVQQREWLPSEPFTFWKGRLVVSGDASVTYGPRDKGYFDTLDYYHDTFSVLRLGVSAAFRVNDRISVLGQVVDDVALRGDPFVEVDRQVMRVYALFVRVQPWTTHAFNVQAGRVPPVFGAFGRQGYGSDNPLIGVPLAYQYQTTLRADAVPGNATALLDRRGNGWSFRYQPAIGAQYFAPGLPLVASQQWDTGVQLHWGTNSSPVDVSVALTNGTLSYPRVDDNNGGKQIAGRVAFRPATGLVAGLSAARGAFLDREVTDLLPSALRHDSFTQRAFGADAEYSRGYWLVRGETILSAWRVPPVDTRLNDSLRAWASFIEARWRFDPRWYLAGRAEHLGFSTIDGPLGTRVTWDQPVTRLEAGVGYTIRRNVRAKISYQYNWRDAARVRREGLVGAQLVYWF